MSEAAPPRMAPGITAGLVLSVPVALRCAPGWPQLGCVVSTQRPIAAGLLMLAAASLVVVPVGLWIRHASLKDSTNGDRAILLGTALSSLPLALFGGVLKSTTHHRPLGGATFAAVACVVLALCIALSHRAGKAAAKSSWLKHFFSVSCWLSLGGTVAFAASGAHTLLDFLTLAGACAGAGLLKIPKALQRVPLAPVAVAWGLLLGCALFLSREQGLMRELALRAPISFAALSWLGDGS